MAADPEGAAAARIMGATLTVSAMDFTRITIDLKRISGVPIIRNLRIPVATVVDTWSRTG